MPFLPPNQQSQSTEGKSTESSICCNSTQPTPHALFSSLKLAQTCLMLHVCEKLPINVTGSGWHLSGSLFASDYIPCLSVSHQKWAEVCYWMTTAVYQSTNNLCTKNILFVDFWHFFYDPEMFSMCWKADVLLAYLLHKTTKTSWIELKRYSRD